jgi:cysteine synthase A
LIYNDITELIGNTPLVKFGNLDLPEGISLYAKLEYYNPGGSVKDRVALSMLDDAEQKGLLKPGGAIVEGTAGNMGLGIATAALNRGYRIIFVVPDKFSQEKQSLMRALGAEIINTSREGGMLEACRKAEEIKDQIPGAVSLKQFENPKNPEAHYASTGPEIYTALDGKLDYLVAGAGSGGTFSGIVSYLKQRDPNIKGVLADPLGSTIGGGEHADYDIEGIGNDFVPTTMDLDLIDRVIKISDTDAYKTVKQMALKEGVIVGSSSGAATWGALELARQLDADPARDKDQEISIVAILPDRGDRYFSKGLFD